METPKMNTQDLAEELLYAEAHLSVLWEDIPSESGKRTDKPGNSEVTRLQSTGPDGREGREVLLEEPCLSRFGLSAASISPTTAPWGTVNPRKSFVGVIMPIILRSSLLGL